MKKLFMVCIFSSMILASENESIDRTGWYFGTWVSIFPFIGAVNMKRIVIIIMITLGIVSCGVNCDSKPPKRAVMHTTGGMGMQYHFALYLPMEGNSHSSTFKCPKQEYQVTHVYTDDLGTVQRENLIWKIRLYGNEYRPIPETDVAQKQTILTFTQKDVIVQGLTGDFEPYNGTYKIETSSPDSWGIELVD